jgi:alpha-1,2-mannosyltransferase
VLIDHDHVPAQLEPLFRRRWALAAAVVALAGVAVVVLAPPHHFFDLKVYQGAVRGWLHGRSLYSYDMPADRRYGFTYPPFAALCLAPLAALPFPVAAAVLATGTLAAIGVTTWWLTAPLADRHGWRPWLVFALAVPVVLVMQPVRQTITLGQLNLLLALLVMADLRALRRGDRWAGVGVGLATALKLTPGVFVLYLLVARRWRAAATSAAVLAGATLFGAVASPGGSWRYWTVELWQTSRVGPAGSAANQALSGLITRLGNTDTTLATSRPDALVWAAACAVTLLVGLYRAGLATRRGDPLAAFTLTGLTAGLVSPISWTHHLYWVVPAIAVAVDAGLRRPDPRWLLAAGAMCLLFSTAIIPTFWHPGGHHYQGGWPGVLGENLDVLGCAVVLLVLPAGRRRRLGPVRIARNSSES